VGGAVTGAYAAAPTELDALAAAVRGAGEEYRALRERVEAVDVAASRPWSPDTWQALRGGLAEATRVLERAERGAVDLADRLAENARAYADTEAAVTRLLDVAPAAGPSAPPRPPAAVSWAVEPAFALPERYDGPVTVRPVGRGARIARAAPAKPAATDPAAVLARAEHWADLRVGYSMTGLHDGYRTDCSGLVSMAWGLPPPGLTTVTLPQVSHRIGRDDLRPGDILLNPAPGAAGHTLIFAGWADAGHSRYYAYEESASKGAHFGTVPYPYWPGHGTFRPYRFDG
jgi:cell wall-associated NlpC family hydrolase